MEREEVFPFIFLLYAPRTHRRVSYLMRRSVPACRRLYRESSPPRAPICTLVTLSNPQTAADFSPDDA
ncbi:hypothetical protein PBY51_008286 [Eleginops maclovinus]|uniref:Uncharacterized protein n=1 Tax=Eleginops maclovinus TaxID=56733 RepID=A0AAN8AEB2_ELEMC|nr:hypothetical protein PBY51_008286 [Eleginops maclovinus]